MHCFYTLFDNTHFEQLSFIHMITIYIVVRWVAD